MKKDKFQHLVSKGVILKPEKFSEGHKKRINSLTADEVKALVSIRAKLGSRFIRSKSTGPSPSMAIVF